MAAAELGEVLSAPFDPLLLVDASGVLTTINRAAELQLGLNSQVGQRAEQIAAIAPIFEALSAPPTTGGGPIWAASNGHSYRVLTTTTPAHGLLICLRDVSDLQQLGSAVEDFMHVVSHDLRTPLTALKSYAEMLVEGDFGTLQPEQQTAMEKLTISIYGMVALVNNLQAADRFDPKRGRYGIQYTMLDLTDLLRRILEDQQLPAELHKVRLELDIDPSLPIVRADQLMLERALANLVDNAIKFSPEGTTIRVEVKADGTNVMFAVRDHGPGIAPEDQTRIFERSVRVEHPGQKRVRGSGLGLYVVKTVAERHGGSVWVESALGQGSSFFLRLPVRAEAATG